MTSPTSLPRTASRTSSLARAAWAKAPSTCRAKTARPQRRAAPRRRRAAAAHPPPAGAPGFACPCDPDAEGACQCPLRVRGRSSVRTPLVFFEKPGGHGIQSLLAEHPHVHAVVAEQWLERIG